MIPQFDKIELYKFYELYEYGWTWQYAKIAKRNNGYTLQAIAKDFAECSDISFSDIIKVLSPNNVIARCEEYLLLLYTYKYSSQVNYYLTHEVSKTYEGLIKNY